MGIPDHLTCLLRNLYAGQEAIVRTRHEIMDWFKIRDGVGQGCLFNLYASCIRWSGWLTSWNQDYQEKYQQPQICRDVTLMAENEEELKSLLMKVKEKAEKSGLKLNIQKTKIMASSLITSRQIDGKKVETVAEFIFLGTKITVGGDCSCEIKSHLLLERKAMTNLGSVLKSKDITLPTEVILIVKAMVFPIQMYRCESWTIKKVEHWSWYFETGVADSWESLGQEENQTSPSKRKSTLNIHWKDWHWSWNSNNLATWCEELTHWKGPWCWGRFKAGGEEGNGGWDDWMSSLTQWTWVAQALGDSERQGSLACCNS